MLPVATPAIARTPRVVSDQFGRTLRYVRLSVTEVCNLACEYCSPIKGCGATHPYRLSWDDLDFLADVCVNDLGVEAIRITGGEPTVRPGLIDWIAGIRRHGGLIDVALTTNGVLLEKMAPDLERAGLTRVNVSIDTFDETRFRELTRGGSLPRVMAGLDAARRHFRRVKVNAVALRGITTEEIPRFVELSDAHGTEVRFIELMPIFDQKEYWDKNFISVGELMTEFERLGHRLLPEGDGAAQGNRTGYGPATTYSVEGSRARFGFISQMSSTKCVTCNKLRLTSDGALKPCLLSPKEVDLGSAILARDRTTIADEMRAAFEQRPERYDEGDTRRPLGRSMQATGG